MLLCKIVPFHLISKFPFPLNSSKDRILLLFERLSLIALSLDGLVFLNVKGDNPVCRGDIVFNAYLSHHNR